MENEVIKVIADNWEICFLYGLKYLKDLSKNVSDHLGDLKTIVAVHEAEIENIKERLDD